MGVLLGSNMLCWASMRNTICSLVGSRSCNQINYFAAELLATHGRSRLGLIEPPVQRLLKSHLHILILCIKEVVVEAVHCLHRWF